MYEYDLSCMRSMYLDKFVDLPIYLALLAIVITVDGSMTQEPKSPVFARVITFLLYLCSRKTQQVTRFRSLLYVMINTANDK